MPTCPNCDTELDYDPETEELTRAEEDEEDEDDEA